jgi:hypothetical protein
MLSLQALDQGRQGNDFDGADATWIMQDDSGFLGKQPLEFAGGISCALLAIFIPIGPVTT